MSGFKTSRGHCSVSDSVLHIEESTRGQLARYYEAATGSIRGFLLVAVGAIGFAITIAFVANAGIEFVLLEALLLALLIGAGYAADYYRGFRRPEEIPLESITEIQYVDASMWNNKRFIVSYEDEGQFYRRRIQIPSQQFPYSAQELDTAQQLFRTLDAPYTG